MTTNKATEILQIMAMHYKNYMIYSNPKDKDKEFQAIHSIKEVLEVLGYYIFEKDGDGLWSMGTFKVNTIIMERKRDGKAVATIKLYNKEV